MSTVTDTRCRTPDCPYDAQTPTGLCLIAMNDDRKEPDMGLIRQGDVLLIPVTTIPDDAKRVRREHGRCVLAHGEITGHHHSIASPDVTLVSKQEADELRMWLIVSAPEPVELEHQEHDTLLIPPALYEVRRQREYTPEEIRTVAD